MGEQIALNDGWIFEKEWNEKMLEGEYSSETMENVRLPHSNVIMPFHYFDETFYQGIFGYQKRFFAPNEWKDKGVILSFEGVGHACEVYLNKEKLGSHACGYTGFSFDIGKKLLLGQENIITVKVSSEETLNQPPFGFVIDYMTYGGMYREVSIEVKNSETYMKNLYVHGKAELHSGRKVKKAGLEVTFDLSKSLDESVKKYVHVTAYMKKHNGSEAFKCLQEKNFDRNLQFEIEDEISLWDVNDPNLYDVKVVLSSNESEMVILDEKTVTIGFRKMEFKADGFYLNNQKLKIRGLNRHQSYPYVGYAMPQSIQEMDAKVLKEELGLNAVRTSHYPQSKYFYDKCDELGLLVFTEMPGWQHIGDEAWIEQAIVNAKDMILENRNHASIMLWGVRINESPDSDSFYQRTNVLAHELDPYRATGGVRCIKKSHLYEDVYTYNDFIHDGITPGCTKKKAVTPDMKKGYLVSEYCGHMFPTKSYDNETRRIEHAIRHARILNAIQKENNIAGSFGWCMADYNTHKDFGSGDRICYHGVLDMFRNPKSAAYIYSSQREDAPELYVSSSMDIGEHNACVREDLWVFTNADEVHLYKNDELFVKFKASKSPFKYLKHGPILIDDFVGDALVTKEHMKSNQAKTVKKLLNLIGRYGMTRPPKAYYWLAFKTLFLYKIPYDHVVSLFNTYIGNWGGSATVYRYDAIKDGQTVKSIIKYPMSEYQLELIPSHTELVEKTTYDVAAVRIRAVDEHGNILPCYNDAIQLQTTGNIALIGPNVVSLQGGMGGTYVKSLGENGVGKLVVKYGQDRECSVEFNVKCQ